MSWQTFPYQPAVFCALTALLFVGAAATFVLGGLYLRVTSSGDQTLMSYTSNSLILAFGILGVLSARGFMTALTARKLHVVPQPAPEPTATYR